MYIPSVCLVYKTYTTGHLSGHEREEHMNYEHDLNILFKEKEYVCPVHGNIGNAVMHSTMPEIRTTLCLVCYIEKLMDIGVCEVKEKNT